MSLKVLGFTVSVSLFLESSGFRYVAFGGYPQGLSGFKFVFWFTLNPKPIGFRVGFGLHGYKVKGIEFGAHCSGF